MRIAAGLKDFKWYCYLRIFLRIGGGQKVIEMHLNLSTLTKFGLQKHLLTIVEQYGGQVGVFTVQVASQKGHECASTSPSPQCRVTVLSKY